MAESVKITVAQLVELGGVGKTAVYKQIKAKKLTFRNGKADPLKLSAEWEKKRDPSQDDKIGPAIERVIGALGLITQPDPDRGRPGSEDDASDDPAGGDETYWQVRTRHEKAKAETAELVLAERQSKLLDADLVASQWAKIGVFVRDEVLSIPTRIVNRLPDEWRRQVNTIATEETRRALAAISHEFRKPTDSKERVR